MNEEMYSSITTTYEQSSYVPNNNPRLEVAIFIPGTEDTPDKLRFVPIVAWEIYEEKSSPVTCDPSEAVGTAFWAIYDTYSEEWWELGNETSIGKKELMDHLRKLYVAYEEFDEEYTENSE